MTPIARVELALAIREAFIARMDHAAVGRSRREHIVEAARRDVIALVAARAPDLEEAVTARVVEDVLDNIFGLGPLEPLLRDHDVDAIEVRGPHDVTVRRGDAWESTDCVFRDGGHLMATIERVADAMRQPIGVTGGPLELDLAMVDGSSFRAWREDGVLRVNIVRPWSPS